MQDRTQTISMAAHPGDNVHPVRTANYHFAAMRRAEQAARNVSDDIAGHRALTKMTGIAWDEAAERAAARDSYYLLAAAHREAGLRRERVERRAAAWAGFRSRPSAYTRSVVRDMVRSLRQSVNV